MIRRLATMPDSLIRRRTPERGLTLETIVVLVCGLLGGAGFAYVMLQAVNATDVDNSMFQIRLLGEVLRPILLTVVVWVLYTVAAHVVANTSGGRGPISRLMRGAAWALIPIGIWNLLRSIVVAVLFLDAEIPADPEGLSAAEKVQSILDLGLDGGAYAAVILAGVLFVAWSWHLLSVAVAESKGLDVDEARKAAAVPAGLFALYLLWTGLGWAGVL